MEKINVAELLKDSPSGTELNCTMYEDVYFDYIDELCNIYCYIKNEDFRTSIMFNRHGRPNSNVKSKCVIFPKGKTTWEGFVPPSQFKDGDIVYVKTINRHEYTIIFKEIKNDYIYKYACLTYLRFSIDNCPVCQLDDAVIMRPATEEEKQKLFDAIKANGYRWNAETKTLEKLFEPKFKVGDKIRHKTHIIKGNTVTEIKDTHYILDDELALPFINQDNYELVPNKFNITNLKPFDKVLVRDNNEQKWTVDLFSFYDKDLVYKYVCVGHYVNQCIPYEGNEHLLGTANDCDEYYKTWK